MKLGEKMASEQKQMISNSEKGKFISKETRLKISIARKTNPNLFSKKGREHPAYGLIPWNKGLKTGQLSLEHRKKISVSNSKPKSPFTQEHKNNIRIARAKQVMHSRSPQTISKIKAKRSLQIMPMRDSKPERMMQIGLMLHGVKFEKHKTITDGMGFYHQVDIFIEPNICVEIDGDYWHANPRIYHMDFVIKTRKNLVVTAKDIWFRDALVNNKLKQLSYQTIRIWESDLKINPRKEVFGILQLIEKESV